MISLARLQKLAREHGTPLFVVDHDEIRRSYRAFRRLTHFEDFEV